jgi:hypothetical protein
MTMSHTDKAFLVLHGSPAYQGVGGLQLHWPSAPQHAQKINYPTKLAYGIDCNIQ